MNNYNTNTPYQQTQGTRMYKGQYYTDSQLQPISAWGYFGYMLLFSIPLLGFILLIVFSVSDDNINRRNFARSYWCSLVIALIIIGLILVIALVSGGLSNLSSWLSSILPSA
ncbi:MAG: hypothetical protein IKX86_03375 [Clostridia bacterium]|nr:hypothetical protein [Clostridia bacterium]MBR5767701.1 hypothetical protein [Clostridia bacterium]